MTYKERLKEYAKSAPKSPLERRYVMERFVDGSPVSAQYLGSDHKEAVKILRDAEKTGDFRLRVIYEII